MKINYLYIALRLIECIILLQTLYFKFTASPESVYIFTKIWAEPIGRIRSGIVELIASILLLYPPAIFYGALLSLGVISGAILLHLTILGIDVQGDGGLLFGLALVTWVCSAILVIVSRKQFPLIKF